MVCRSVYCNKQTCKVLANIGGFYSTACNVFEVIFPISVRCIHVEEFHLRNAIYVILSYIY
jgi:hypothetical protein